MKKYIAHLTLGISLIISSICCPAQVVITDSVTVAGVFLRAAVPGSSVPISPAGAGDDAYSDVIPIGFTFNFYGTDHTQCLIGSNGAICFDLSNALQYQPWPISAVLSANTSAFNSICAAWCDMYLPAGGYMYYYMDGTAPNRRFIVMYCGVHMYSCTSQYTSSAVILYETSNIIDVFTMHHTYCTG